MGENLEALKKRLADIGQLHRAAAVLGWDMRTYMPPGGASARSEQLAYLSKLTHEMFISEETGKLLEKSENECAGIDQDSNEAKILRNVRRSYDHAVKIPTPLAEEFSRHTTLSEDVWTRARAENRYSDFAPYLEKTLDLLHQMIQHLGYEEEPYDTLLDMYERGAKTKDIEAVFQQLEKPLVDMVRAIAGATPKGDNSPLIGNYSSEKQNQLTLKVVASLGYDLNRGRQDPTVHPFCCSFSRDDVRITTRFSPERLEPALFGSMHESGHAMYDQNIPAEYDNTPIGGAASLGVHESQSRFWENIVGRSLPFCEFILPLLRETFPDPFESCDAARFHRSINRVHPSCIRVEADEVTYNLHILLRFQMERDMLSGKITIKDLPDAWNAKMESLLGITPPNDTQGVLQDIHWAGGMIGYFPTYTLGNLLSAQLWRTMRNDIANPEEHIRKGDFAPLLGWLRENVHRHGSRYFSRELIPIVTGEPLNPKHFLDYLQSKYSQIYDI
jgi:carboxypeptidase Taq